VPVHNRLCYYLESKSLISPTQAGFRPGRSTIVQVFLLSQSIWDHLQKKRPPDRTLLATIDFSKAFDSPSSILSCIGKRARESCDRSSGQFTADKTGKGQFLRGNWRDLAKEGVVGKILSPQRVASVSNLCKDTSLATYHVSHELGDQSSIIAFIALHDFDYNLKIISIRSIFKNKPMPSLLFKKFQCSHRPYLLRLIWS